MTGITAVYSSEDVTRKAYYALVQTQHRGQETAGISAAGDYSIRTQKGEGFISSVLTKEVLGSFTHPSDYITIGNVGNRKVKNKKDTSPVELEFNSHRFSISMDGMILNHSEVDKKFGFNTTSDEELFGRIFHKYLRESNKIDDVAHLTMKNLEKAYYSLAMIVLDKRNNESQLLALRDKKGIKPMYLGLNDSSVAITSESGAIDTLKMLEKEGMKTRDVKPGEMISASNYDIFTKQILPTEPAHCAFEWVYTSRVDAIMNGINAHAVRKKLGKSLVKLHNIKNDGKTVGGGIPTTGRSVVIGICEETGIPYDEVMIKNESIGRTYIMPDPSERYIAVFLKHNPIKSSIENKKVIIGDDSIVRGSISEGVARTLRKAGAKEVKLAVSYAPIFYPCFEDEPNKKLAAAGLEVCDIYEIGKKITKKLPTIKKVMYNTPEAVIEAIGLPEDHLCTYCITGKNPFEK
jgi:amidophosphoribosyltransferase